MGDGRGAEVFVLALLAGSVASACVERAPNGKADSADGGGENGGSETVTGAGGDPALSTAGSANTVRSTGGGQAGNSSGSDSGGSATGGAGGATSCDGILLNNDGRPEDYPAIFREAADAGTRFEAARAALLSTYELQATDYVISGAPITWAPTIDSLNPLNIALRLGGGPFDASNTGAAALAFLTEFSEIFGFEASFVLTSAPFCGEVVLTNSNTSYRYCQVWIAQDYCGLAVHSPETESDYSGQALIRIHSEGGVELVRSNLVPVLPMPRNVLLDQAEITGAIVGQPLTFYCNVERSIVLSEADTLDVSPNPVVFVRSSPTVPAALEYRLAVRVEVVTLGMFVYVDGIDGTLLETFVNVTC